MEGLKSSIIYNLYMHNHELYNSVQAHLISLYLASQELEFLEYLVLTFTFLKMLVLSNSHQDCMTFLFDCCYTLLCSSPWLHPGKSADGVTPGLLGECASKLVLPLQTIFCWSFTLNMMPSAGSILQCAAGVMSPFLTPLLPG